MRIRSYQFAALVCASLLLASCDDDAKTGHFIDAQVFGLAFTTGSGSGFTGAPDGAFPYEDGDSVTFSVGNIVLGTAPAAAIVTPYDLVSGSDITKDPASNPVAVTNIARLLISLDSDCILANGITLTPDTQARAAAFTTVVDLASAGLTGGDALVAAAGNSCAGGRLVSADIAQQELQRTASRIIAKRGFNRLPSAGVAAVSGVDPANTALVAACPTAGNLFTENCEVVLVGKTSSDPDGKVVGYRWTQIDGPRVTLNAADTDAAFFDAPLVERKTDFKFQLSVTDDEGGVSATPTEIIITVDNAPTDLVPAIVNAGDNQTVNERATVVLNGSVCDGTLNCTAPPAPAFRWEQILSPGQPEAILSNCQTGLTANPARVVARGTAGLTGVSRVCLDFDSTQAAALQGLRAPDVLADTVLRFRFTASIAPQRDAAGNIIGPARRTGSKDLLLTVRDATRTTDINTPPTVDAGQDQVVSFRESSTGNRTVISLVGNGSDPDMDSLIGLEELDRPLGFFGPDPIVYTWTQVAPIALDNAGNNRLACVFALGATTATPPVPAPLKNANRKLVTTCTLPDLDAPANADLKFQLDEQGNFLTVPDSAGNPQRVERDGYEYVFRLQAEDQPNGRLGNSTATAYRPAANNNDEVRVVARKPNIDLPRVTLNALDATIGEGRLGEAPGRLRYQILLDRSSTVPVSVNFQTVNIAPPNDDLESANHPAAVDETAVATNGEAGSGRDYTPVLKRVTFDPGITRIDVTVDVLGDNVVESNMPGEILFTMLSSPVNAVLQRSTASSRIRDPGAGQSMLFPRDFEHSAQDCLVSMDPDSQACAEFRQNVENRTFVPTASNPCAGRFDAPGCPLAPLCAAPSPLAGNAMFCTATGGGGGTGVPSQLATQLCPTAPGAAAGNATPGACLAASPLGAVICQIPTVGPALIAGAGGTCPAGGTGTGVPAQIASQFCPTAPGAAAGTATPQACLLASPARDVACMVPTAGPAVVGAAGGTCPAAGGSGVPGPLATQFCPTAPGAAAGNATPQQCFVSSPLRGPLCMAAPVGPMIIAGAGGTCP